METLDNLSSQSKSVANKFFELLQAANERAMKQLLGKLGLCHNYLVSRSLDIYLTAKARQAEPHIVTEVLQVASVCVACREQQVPIFLADLAGLVQLSVAEFASVLRRVISLVGARAPAVDTKAFVRIAIGKIFGAGSSTVLPCCLSSAQS